MQNRSGESSYQLDRESLKTVFLDQLVQVHAVDSKGDKKKEERFDLLDHDLFMSKNVFLLVSDHNNHNHSHQTRFKHEQL